MKVNKNYSTNYKGLLQSSEAYTLLNIINGKKARAANYYNKATPITVINENATCNKLRSKF